MNAKLRAWWFEKQGLGGMSGTPRDVLTRSGWARGVGGANPYVSIFARTGGSMAEVDAAVAAQEIHELPSARGCTYVLPAEDYGIGLRVGQGTGEQAAIRTSTKWLGVTEAELDRLNRGILDGLAKGPLDPTQLRDALGGLVRSLGDEGKKRGQTTTLPLALGWLQAHGLIRRISTNGRLDGERYRYALWDKNPLEGAPDREQAFVELARKYWRWIGPARLADFQWFSGLGVAASKQAVEPLGLVPAEGDFLIHADEQDAYEAFQPPREPVVKLIASIDALLLLRRDAPSLVEPEDRARQMRGGKDLLQVGGVQDLEHHGIIDRGRLIGFWEYDPERSEIVWSSFQHVTDPLRKAVADTEAFARDQLGDVRSFSLDSPKSRQSRLEFLRSGG